jgi:hypothetical protein
MKHQPRMNHTINEMNDRIRLPSVFSWKMNQVKADFGVLSVDTKCILLFSLHHIKVIRFTFTCRFFQKGLKLE